MVAAMPLVVLRCAWRRDARALCVAVLAPLVACAQGGVVRGGWFPSGLRHQALAMTLLLVPVALVAGWALRAFGRWRATFWASHALAPLGCAAAFARGGVHALPTLPAAAEYAFVRDAVDAMAPGDSVLTLPAGPLDAVPMRWFETRRSDIGVVDLSALPPDHRGGATWLLLDRSCSVDATCYVTPWRCPPGPPPETAAEPVAAQCAELLRARPWRRVRALQWCQPALGGYLQPYDLPPRQRCNTLELYRWP